MYFHHRTMARRMIESMSKNYQNSGGKSKKFTVHWKSMKLPSRTEGSDEFDNEEIMKSVETFKLQIDKRNPKFHGLKKNDELCDVKLIGRTGEEILAHKSVLAASSEYFNVLFSGKFKDFDKSEINIPELDPVVLELLIDFFYTYELNISEDYVQETLFGAILFQLDEIVTNKCIDFILARVDSSNCLGTKELGWHLELKKVFTFCLNYALNNYMDVVKHKEFLSIDFIKLLEMLTHQDLCASEENVYESIITWINYNLEDRSKHLPDLLGHVRLPIVSPTFIKNVVNTEPLLKQNIDCNEFITKVNALQGSNDLILEVPDKTHVKYRSNYLKHVIVINHSDEPCLPYLFDVFSHKWKYFDELLPSRPDCKAYLLNNGHVLDIGKMTNRTTVSFLMPEKFEFIYEAISWSTKKFKLGDIRPPRINYELIEFGEFIYVIGGSFQNYESNLVEKYDVKSDTWFKASPMIHRREFPTLCVDRNYLYAIGGMDNVGNYLNMVEKYDPVTDTWEEMPELIRGRVKAGAVAANGLIYVFGGLNRDCTIEVYSPFKNKWTIIESKLPAQLGSTCMCSIYPIHLSSEETFD